MGSTVVAHWVPVDHVLVARHTAVTTLAADTVIAIFWRVEVALGGEAFGFFDPIVFFRHLSPLFKFLKLHVGNSFQTYSRELPSIAE